MITKKLSIALVVSLLANTAYADVWNYSYDLISKQAPLKVDDGRMLLTWQGRQYKIIATTGTLDGGVPPAFDDDSGCGKYCFYAAGHGKKLTVNAMTQGYAELHEVHGSTVACEIPKAIYCMGHGAYGRCAPDYPD
jgi:hypothetical protein